MQRAAPAGIEVLQSLLGSSPTPASPVCQLHASTVFYGEHLLEDSEPLALCNLIQVFDQLCCESIILAPAFANLRGNDMQIDSPMGRR